MLFGSFAFVAVLLVAWLNRARAISGQEQGGMSTAGAHAAVLDSENRPITARGFVDSGPIVFQDEAVKAGLTVWHHVMGTPEKTYILETVGSGVALLDYDNDGRLDIYLVNGSTYDAMSGKAIPRMPRSFITIMTARSRMSRKRPGSRMIAGSSELRSETMTMMAGQTYMSAIMARTGSITTTTMERSRM